MFTRLFERWNRSRLKDDDYAYLFDPYEGDEVIIYDTETTGLNPKKDEVLSIGAIKVKGNRILTSEMFEVFLRPSGAISKKSIEIHGIRPCDLDEAIDPDEGIKRFIEFIGNRPLIGYYLEFDVAMIDKYLKRWLGIRLPNQKTEVSGLYYDLKIGRIPQGHVDLRFETIMKELGIPNMGQHNAVNDAIMTAMIYLKIKDKTRL